MPSKELERANAMWRDMWPQKEEPTIEDFREAYERFVANFPVPDDVRAERVDAGGVPAVWVSVEGVPTDRTIFYLHGGGYVIGSAWGYREMTSHMARAAEARALVVDYRLAPEHPFPAAVDDATTAWRWALSNGVAPERAVIAGDSAGGGLTLAALVALRDAGDPLPAAAVALSPWVDMEALGESMVSKAELDPVVGKDGLMMMAEAYLQGQDARSPLAAPLYADLSGLPPLLVQVGTHETLHDDSVRFAEKAKAAGVDVTLDVVDEMVHVWQVFSSFLPEGREAIERMGEFVRKHTA